MNKKAISMPLAPEQPGNQQPFDYPPHPFANVFPRMEGDAFAAFIAAIREKGLVEPIVLYQDKVLDGRNRLAACMAAGVKPRFVKFEGTEAEAFDFVWAKNFDRRDLTTGQRAAAADKRAMLGRGRPPAAGNITGGEKIGTRADYPKAETQAEAAAAAGVSLRAVGQYRRVRTFGVPELVDEVDKGKTSLKAAEAISHLPKDEQAEVVARGEKDILARAKEIRARQQSDKRARRVAEIEKRTVAAGPVGLRTEGQQQTYNVIYCDPPWRLEAWSRETGLDRAADQHYPTMTVDEIARLMPPVAADAVLFLWVTVPHLKSGLELINQWGFAYKSHICWVKDRTGKGYWARNRHELLLIARRGNIPAPAPGTQPDSVIQAPLGPHSQKPAIFADMIAQLYPSLPKLEMYARAPREGWDVWGNEVSSDAVSLRAEPDRSTVEPLGSAQGETAKENQNTGGEWSGDAGQGEGSGRAPDGTGSARPAGQTDAQPEPDKQDFPEMPDYLRRAK